MIASLSLLKTTFKSKELIQTPVFVGLAHYYKFIRTFSDSPDFPCFSGFVNSRLETSFLNMVTQKQGAKASVGRKRPLSLIFFWSMVYGRQDAAVR